MQECILIVTAKLTLVLHLTELSNTFWSKSEETWNQTFNLANYLHDNILFSKLLRNRITFQMTCVNWVMNLHFWILLRKVDLNEFEALQFVHVVLLHVFHFSLFLRLGYTWKMCTTFGCDRGAARPASHSAINRRFWFVNPRMTKFIFFSVFWL